MLAILERFSFSRLTDVSIRKNENEKRSKTANL